MDKPDNILLKHTGIVFIFLLILVSDSFAANPDTAWTKTFGGTNIDIGYCVKQTSDGGYIITGYTRSYGLAGHNVWLIKTDSAGTKQWDNTFGGNSDDEAYSVAQTNDGGYILTGFTNSYGAGGKDVILIKTNSLGTGSWEKSFGGSSDEEGYSVLQSNDGGFVLAGATSSFGTAGSRDVWMIKTDGLGNELWRKNFGGYGSDGARSIDKTMDGGYIITGWTYSYGPGSIGNVWLVKTDSSGNMQWNKYFGGNDVDRGWWVKQTSDSGYILTGYTSSSGAGLDDMLLIKTNSAGIEEWSKTFGGTGRDYGNSVQQTAEGGYIVAGYTLSYGAGGDDVWLVKTDPGGTLEWSKTLGGLYSDQANAVANTSDGGCIITGHTLSFGAGVHDVWLIKMTAPIPVELRSFTAEADGNNVIVSWTTSTETNNRGFYVERKSGDLWKRAGFVEGKGSATEQNEYKFFDKDMNPGDYIYKLGQMDFNGSINYSYSIEIKVGLPHEFILEQNYPNPFNPVTEINFEIPVQSKVIVKVYDVLGNEAAVLLNEEKPAGKYSVSWKPAGIPSGVYIYEITAGNFRSSRKMILMK